MVLLNRRARTFDINLKDKRGQTPLHYAVEKQDHEMLRVLLQDPYVDVNCLDD